MNNQKLVDAIETVIGCFRAAETEGLSAVLAATADEAIKDLVERRLMHALYAAEEALHVDSGRLAEVGQGVFCNYSGRLLQVYRTKEKAELGIIRRHFVNCNIRPIFSTVGSKQ